MHKDLIFKNQEVKCNNITKNDSLMMFQKKT